MGMDFSFLAQEEFLLALVDGLLVTCKLFLASWVCGFAIALVMANLRDVRFAAVRFVVSAFLEYHRNVPTVVQMLVWYFAMPELLPDSLRLWINRGNTEFLFAWVALSLNVSAYFAEDIRSGIRAIPATQFEAARAIGLSALGGVIYVILPQAVRLTIPTILNRTLILFKDTSLAMAIGVSELTYQVRNIENITFRAFEAYFIATVIYLTISLLIMFAGAWFSRRFTVAYR
ncbi:amino acid ABC transporter permease [Aquamicrobium sp. NLF2-7]|jgi:polar amino acid transport system permease protein|uniref:amino acid ABC transporter permease n=2 Tax=unclassified Aquamicrobium TaxID=2618194 RepID=UPI001EFA3CEA|nr:amino acid ABC transporter permease [Aquamicrobium sp. NLF2-7]MCG8274382.1 amino acid ABC transporter permease [Aquamicrobium sp. NLF2-7]